MRTTQYQRPVLVLFVGVGATVAALNLVCIGLLLRLLLPGLNSEPTAGEVLTATSIGCVALPLSLVVGILFLYMTTRRLVGPFVRIMHELDDVLDGKRSGPLTTRKGDMLAEDMLERVNALIARASASQS